MNGVFNYLNRRVQYLLTVLFIFISGISSAQCPTADAGGNRRMCESENNISINATATNYVSITWTSDGTGTFSAADVEDPVYTPSAADINQGSVVLRMTVNQDPLLCPGQNEVSSQMVLIISESPFANAGIDQTICESGNVVLTGVASNASSILWTTTGDGSFSSNTSLSTIYFPGVGDIAAGTADLTLTARGDGGCSGETASDDLRVTIIHNPTISAGADAVVCENNSYTISTAAGTNYASLSWSSSGSGSFINANSLTPSYTPSADDANAGSVVLTVSADPLNPCSTVVSDAMTLTVGTQPSANAGLDAVMCQSDGLYTLNGTASNHSSVLWTSLGDGVFVNPNTLNPTYTPGPVDIANGAVTLRITANGVGSCAAESNSDEMVLSIVSSPVANAGVDAAVCRGADYNLLGTAENYSSLLWTSSGDGVFAGATTLTPTYTPGPNDIANGSAQITLTVRAIVPCSVDDADVMTLSIIEQPSVNAGVDIESCGNAPVSITTSSAANQSSLLWTTGGTGTFSDPSVINPQYIPSALDIASGSVTLTITAQPNMPCVGAVSDNLILSLTGEPTAFAGADAAICEGSSYTVIDGSSGNASSVLWTTAGDGVIANADSDTPTYTPGANDIANGTVTLQMTVEGINPCANVVVDELVITIDHSATANAGVNAVICSSGSYTTAATASNYSSIIWTTSGTGTFTNPGDLVTNYTPSASDITDGSVELTLTAQGNGACALPVSSTIILTIIDGPTADAGPDHAICVGPNLISGSSADNYGSITWTSSGDGSFINNNVENPIYTPGVGDIAAGTVLLTMSVAPIAPCGVTVSDDVVLTVIGPAIVSAGADGEICETTPTYTLNGATGMGATSYLWVSSGTGTFIDNSIINATYLPSAGDILNGGVTLTLTASNPPCVVTPSSMFLTIHEEPEVDAGSNITICDNTNVTLSTASASDYSSILWTTSGTGTFVDATLETPTYNPSAADYLAGSVTLTLTANPIVPCMGAVFDTMILDFQDEATADAGSGGTICENGSFTVVDAAASNYDNVSWSGGDGTWTGQNTLVPTYTPGPNDIVWGSVTLSLTANPLSPCSAPVVDNTTLLIQSLPDVDAGNNESICQGEAIAITTASVENHTSILWTTTGTGTFDDATIISPIYTPSAADISAGNVTLRLTATSILPCGGTQDDSMELTILPDPVANAGSDATICEDGSYFIFDATASNNSTTVWTTSGDGSFDNSTILDPVYTPGVTDVANGSVTLTLTTTGVLPCLGFDNDQMIITIDPLPTVEAGVDGSICSGDIFVTTTATVADYTSVEWTSDGTGAFTNNSQIVTSYTPSAQDILNGTVTLTLTANPTGSCTNTVSDQVRVTIVNPPEVDAGPDQDICENGITIVTATADNFSTILWTSSGSAGTLTNSNTLFPTYTPSPTDIANGIVTLTVTAQPNDPCAAPVSDNVVLRISPDPDVFAGDDATICQTETFTVLTASVSDYSGLTWSSSGDGSFLNNGTLSPTYVPGPNDIIDGTATLTLTADAVLPCTNTPSDDLVLTIQNVANVEAGSSVTLCDGGVHTTIDATASDYASLTWSSSGTGAFNDNSLLHTSYTPSAADLANGFVVLTLAAENLNPCIASQTDDLTILYQDEPVANAGSDARVCENETFTVSDASASANAAILWTTSGNGTFINENSLTPTYTPGSADADAGTVTLTMTVDAVSPCLGSASDQIILTVDPMPEMNAGQDGSVCEGGTFTVTTAAASDYSSFVWTSSGTGIFTNGNTLSPTYTPSADDLALGSVILRLTGQAVAPCVGEHFDEMTLTVVPLSSADAGNDETICSTDILNITTAIATDYASLIWTTSGTGVFSDAAALNPQYLPSVDDIAAGSVILTLTAVSENPCVVNASDAMTLTIDPSPVAFAGSDIDACEGTTVTVADARAENFTTIAWSTLGTGTLTDANTLTPSYTISSDDKLQGSVILTMTVSGSVHCADSIDELVINIINDPVVDAGSDAVACNGANYQIVGVSVSDYNTLSWTSSGTGVFSNTDILLPEYIPSPGDLAVGSVVLTLTATANSPCSNSDADSFVLTFQDEATANAGADEVICEGEDLAINTASATNFSSVTWTSSGSGSFSGGNTLSPVYSPSAADIANGNVTLTLTSEGVAPCSAVSDDMLLTIQQQVVADAGSNEEICVDQVFTISTASADHYETLNWTTNGDGIIMGGNTLTPVYTPGVADLAAGSVNLTLEATAQAPCLGSVSSTMTLTFSDQVSVDAGADVTICEGNNYINADAVAANESSVLWTTSGSGTFTDASLLNATYLPSIADFASGTVTLTLTAQAESPCLGSVSDNVLVTLIANPIVEAGVDASICQGDTYTVNTATASLYNNLYWTSSGNGSFTGGSTLTPTYTPSSDDIAAGAVTLSLVAESDAPCSLTISDSFTLSIMSNASANAGSDAVLCSGQSYTVTDASAQNYSTVTWTTTGSGLLINPNTLTPTYTPSDADIAAGSVDLVLSAASNMPCLLIADDVMTIQLFDSPEVFAGDDDGICENETYTLVNATASDYSALLWLSDGDGTFSNTGDMNPVYSPGPNDRANGSVILRLQATANLPCVNTVQDFMELTVSPLAEVYAGPDLDVCEVSVTLGDATANNYSLLLWTSNGTGLLTNANTLTPTYSPSAQDVANGSVVLTLTATGSAFCTDQVSDQLVLRFDEVPEVFAGNDGSICQNESFTISSSTASNYSTVQWTTSGDGVFSFGNTIQTVYTPGANDIANGSVELHLTANAMAPCTNSVSDVMILTINPSPQVWAGADESVCDGNFTITDATASNFDVVSWSSTGTGLISGGNLLTPTYTPSAEDIANGSVVMTISVTGTDACAAETVQDSKMISFTESVLADAGSDGTICQDDTFEVTDASASNYAALSWSTSGTGIFTNANSLNPIYTPSADDHASGSVILTLHATGTDACGGFTEDDLLLTIVPKPASYAGVDAHIDAGSSYSIVDAVAGNYASLFWETNGTGTFIDDNTLNPVYTPSLDDIANGEVILTLHATANAPCVDDATDFMVLTIGDMPVVDAGDDAEICENDLFVVSTSSASNYSSIVWTSSGTGLLTNETTLFPSYEPSNDDVLNGSVILTATVTAIAPSTTTLSDQMEITFAHLPIVDAGPDASVCDNHNFTIIGSSANGYSTVEWSTSGTGVFANAFDVQTIYMPSENDIANGSVTLTLTASSQLPCDTDVSDSFELSFDPSVFVDAGVDATVCAGGSVTITTASASNYSSLDWTHNGTGTLVDNNTINPSYFPSAADHAAGTVMLTLTGIGNAPCLDPANDHMNIIIADAPEVSAGADTSLCVGDDLFLENATANNYSSVAWTTSGTGVFNNANLLNPTYIPSDNDIINGGVTLTMTVVGNAICPGVYVDQIQVTIIQAPTVDAGDNVSICQGEMVTVNTASATNYSALLWTSDGTGTLLNANTLSPVYIPSDDDIQNGTVILTLTATTLVSCMNEVSDQMLISIGDGSTVFAGSDASICRDMTYTITDAFALNYGSFTWTHNGAGTLSNTNGFTPTYSPHPDDFAAGSVLITLTAEGGLPCPAPVSDVLVLSLFDNPSVNAGADTQICESDTYINIDAVATDYSALLWTSNGSGSFNDNTQLNAVYVPSAADLALGSVVLTLTASPVDPCSSSANDQLVLTFQDQPTVNAGVDDFVCEGHSYAITTATASYYDSMIWTSSGDGVFVNATTLTPTYQPGPNDIVGGSVILSLTVNGNTPCDYSVVDDMVLTVYGHPTIFAGNDALICENNNYTVPDATAVNYSDIQWTASGNGVLENANTLSPTYVPDADDLLIGQVVLTLTATDNAPCTGSISDELIITIQNDVELFAGNDNEICVTDSYVITDATAQNFSVLTWSSSGDGNFDDPTLLHPRYTPGAADLVNGFAVLRLTADAIAPCNSTASDDLVLTFTPEPTAEAGFDGVVCSAQPYTLNSASAANYDQILWTTSGTGTFEDNSVVNAIYTPSDADALAGSVVLTMNAIALAPCNSASNDAMTLTVNQSPVVNAGPDVSLCEGQDLNLMAASSLFHNMVVWSTNGSGSFDNVNIVNAVYTPSAADIANGTVTLTLTAFGNAPCNVPISDEMDVTIIGNPTAYAGADITVCQENVMINDAVADNYSSLMWTSSGTGTFLDNTVLNVEYVPSVLDLANGTVTLTLTANSINPCVGFSVDDVVVSLPVSPSADAGGNAQACVGNMYSPVGIAQNFGSLTWSTSGAGFFIDGNTLTPTYVPHNDDYIAGDVDLTLTAHGIPPCSDVSSTMTLSFVEMPEVEAGNNVTICEGDFVQITDATASNYSLITWASSGTGTLINPNGVDPTYIPDAADILNGSVILTMNVTGQGGCTDVVSDQVLVTIVSSPVVDLGADMSICNNQSYISNTATAENYSSLRWTSSGDGTFSDTSTLITTYSPGTDDVNNGFVVLQLDAEGNDPCGATSDQIIITLESSAFAFAGDDVEICEGIYTVNDAVATNFDAVSWATNGTGFIFAGATLTPTYLPSLDDIANGSVELTMTVDGSAPCGSQVSDVMTISYQRHALADAGPDLSGCADGGILIDGASQMFADSIVWTSSGTGYFEDDHSLVTRYFPSENDELAGTVDISLFVYAMPCGVVSDDMTITIGATPNLTLVDSATICEDDLFDIEGVSASNYSSVTWTSDGSGNFDDATILNPTYTPSVDDIANGFVRLHLALEGDGMCNLVELTDSVDLYINRISQVYVGADTIVCINNDYRLADANVLNYQTVLWTTSGDGTFDDHATVQASYTPGVADLANGNVVLTLTASNAPCESVSDQLTLTVSPQPEVNAGVDATITPTQSYTLATASALNADSVLWVSPSSGTFDDATIVNSTYTPSAFDIQNGFVHLTLHAYGAEDCEQVNDQMLLTIVDQGNNFPVDFLWTDACEANPVQFTIDLSVTNVADIASYLWNFGDGTTSTDMEPNHTFAVAGVYTVSLTATDHTGQQAVISHFVDVNEAPHAFFTYQQPLCSLTEVAFFDASNVPSGYIQSWHWDFGDGSDTLIRFPDDPNVIHHYDLDMTYAVTLTVETSDGCFDYYAQDVAVTPSPIALFSYQDTCYNMSVSFESNAVPNGGGNVVGWFWNFGDPASGIDNDAEGVFVNHEFTQPGDYDVQLAVVNQNGCADTVVNTITILEQPDLDFTWTSNCDESMVNFELDHNVTNIAEIASYLWNFGDGTFSTEMEPGHVFPDNGNYFVQLEITSIFGCTNTVGYLINISESPSALFDVASSTCHTEPVQFTYIPSSPQSPYVVSWHWDFGDGTTATIDFPDDPNPAHTYTDYGTYAVTLTVVNVDGCENSYTESVVVDAAPVANMSFENTCENAEVQFTNLSQGNTGGMISNYLWNFGDPESGIDNVSNLENPTHIFSEQGTYAVSLTVTALNNCSSTKDTLVTITPVPIVDFSYVSACFGEATVFNSSNFVDMDAVATWSWDFGDGFTSTEVDPEHLYNVAGTYDVTLVVTNTDGCVNTETKTVVVAIEPVAAFAHSSSQCANVALEFDDQSYADEAILQWIWDMGDGNVITIDYPNQPDISYTYENSGSYNVNLQIITESGCQSEITNTVQINVRPDALAEYENACLGSPVQFSGDALLNGGAEIWQWNWNFGDPQTGVNNTSELQNPVHTYTESGTYEVSLIVTNMDGCTDTTFLSVTTSGIASFDFAYNEVVCLGDTSFFAIDQNSLDLGIVDYFEWDFGDGAISIGQEVEYSYSLSGTYEVAVTMYDTSGCQAVVTKEVVVVDAPTVLADAAIACETGVTEFSDLSFAQNGDVIIAWDWNFGDPNADPVDNVSTLQHPEHVYSVAGSYTARLSVTTAAGCVDSTSIQVDVFAKPQAAFTFDTTACQSGYVSFVDMSTTENNAIAAWEWTFEDGYYSDNQNPFHIFSHPDSCYDVRLVVFDLNGCTDTLTQSVCVPEGFAADFTFNNVCFGDTTTFKSFVVSPANDSIIDVSWNFGDPESGSFNLSNEFDPVHYYKEPGTYLVSMTATDENYCEYTAYQTVYIKALPIAKFNWENPLCDSRIYFEDQTETFGSQIATWRWSFGDLTGDFVVHAPNDPNIDHVYVNEGTYAVTLFVEDVDGCVNDTVRMVERKPCIQAMFTTPTSEECAKTTIRFADVSGIQEYLTDWSWDFGDGTILNYDVYTPIVEHSFDTAGVYNVSLTVQGVYNDELMTSVYTMPLTINAMPVAKIGAEEVCHGVVSQFYDDSETFGNDIVSWTWHFGDPASLNNTSFNEADVHNYVYPGEFDVNLVVNNSSGCSDDTTIVYHVYSNPVAAIDIDNQGCLGHPVYFTDRTDTTDTHGEVVQWNWDFGVNSIDYDTSEDQNPEYVYESLGVYTVNLDIVDSHGCTSNASALVDVLPVPVASFSYENDQENSPGNVQFTNTSVGDIEYFEWNFGFGSPSVEQDPLVQLPQDGEYVFSLIVRHANQCTDTAFIVHNQLFKTLYIPNAFSPNSPDESIQLFKPVGINLEEYLLTIYDVRGNKLFETNELDTEGRPKEGWDGKYRGVEMPDGIYFYKVFGVFKDGTIWKGNSVGNWEGSPSTPEGTLILIR